MWIPEMEPGLPGISDKCLYPVAPRFPFLSMGYRIYEMGTCVSAYCKVTKITKLSHHKPDCSNPLWRGCLRMRASHELWSRDRYRDESKPLKELTVQENLSCPITTYRACRAHSGDTLRTEGLLLRYAFSFLIAANHCPAFIHSFIFSDESLNLQYQDLEKGNDQRIKKWNQ